MTYLLQLPSHAVRNILNPTLLLWVRKSRKTRWHSHLAKTCCICPPMKWPRQVYKMQDTFWLADLVAHNMLGLVCHHPLIWIMPSSNIQWLAGSELTVGWSSVASAGWWWQSCNSSQMLLGRFDKNSPQQFLFLSLSILFKIASPILKMTKLSF